VKVKSLKRVIYLFYKKLFREEVARRGDEFRRAVFCFGPEEDERYALWYVFCVLRFA
jgi:hypothetical protein